MAARGAAVAPGRAAVAPRGAAVGARARLTPPGDRRPQAPGSGPGAAPPITGGVFFGGGCERGGAVAGTQGQEPGAGEWIGFEAEDGAGREGEGS